MQVSSKAEQNPSFQGTEALALGVARDSAQGGAPEERIWLDNGKYLHQILSAQQAGLTCLPALLGLDIDQFIEFWQRYYEASDDSVAKLKGPDKGLTTKGLSKEPKVSEQAGQAQDLRATDRKTRYAKSEDGKVINNPLDSETLISGQESVDQDLRQSLLDMRREEFDELYQLLLQHRAGRDASEVWLSAAIAAGCFGKEHLWRDLGFPSRRWLSELLLRNFPELVKKNDKDMKWKRFFYKQLCEAEGAYVCRAPTCDECAAYDDCFGSEEE